MRRTPLLLALAALSLAFAPAPLPRPKPDTSKEDLKRMQGEWVLVSRTHNGSSLTGLNKVGIVGERLTFYRPDGSAATKWALTLGAKKSPRWIDCKREWPDNAFTGLGTYELKGDTLTICVVYNRMDRPLDLDGNKPGRWLLVLRRQKR